MYKNLGITIKRIILVFLIGALTYLIGISIAKGLISYATGDEETPETVAEQMLMINKVDELNGEQKRVIQVYVETGIESEEYPIKETTITLDTNIIEGTLEDVQVVAYEKNSYTTGTWEHSNGLLTIQLINENETLDAKPSGTDLLGITFIFADTEVESIKQPLQKVEIELYSGQTLTKEITEKNFDYIDIETPHLYIGSEDIHKTTITDGQVEFTETVWNDLSYRLNVTSLVIEDGENQIYNNDETENTDIKIKYKNTLIEQKPILDLLADEGKLVITDISNNLIILELTKEEIQNLVEGITIEKIHIDEETKTEIKCNVTLEGEMIKIEYIAEVEKIKIELTNLVNQSKSNVTLAYIGIENTKSISNITDTEKLSHLIYTKTYETNEKVGSTEQTIKFKDTVTKATLDIGNKEWLVGQANLVDFTITLDTTSEKTDLFKDPLFLIELPSSVVSINTENSQFTVNNNGGAFYNRRVFITTIMGKKYIAISLEGEQTEESIVDGNTTVNIILELNISENVSENEKTTKLYYQNNAITTYESGASFDTAEVTVSMVMESEPKEEIIEVINPNGEKEEIVLEDDISLVLNCFDAEIIEVGEKLEYIIKVCNYSNTAKNNLQLKSILPEGISIEKITEINDNSESETEYTFDENSRELIINIDSIDASVFTMIEEGFYFPEILGTKEYRIITKADELPEGQYSREIKTRVELLDGENILALSEEKTNTISNIFLSIEVEGTSESITELEEFSLGIKITNNGLINADNVSANINIPEEINFTEFNSMLISSDGSQQTKSSGTVGQELTLNSISLKSGEAYYIQLIGTAEDVQDDTNVTISGTVNEKEFSFTTTIINDVNNTDNPNNPSNPDNPSNPEEPDNPTNPENPSNPDNPSNPSNPDNSTNSGNTENPNDSGNQGGTSEEKFDLSLAQYINKITVTNSNGTTTYNYENTNFAKIEIYRKLMDGSKVTIEYKIVVKNEGTIPGYARKIVDYKPQDLIFNESQNPDWEVEDGNLYTTKFLNTLLNPGDTAEITLILEKEMTNDNVGTIANIAEIYEARNSEGVEDINSVPGDKIEGQNDMSKAEVLVVTSTGTIILYITLATAVIAIIGIGLYRVRKIAINKKGGC